jgi:hypothetical protein
MGRKQLGGPGMKVVLLYLGGSAGESANIIEVSSVAFAVAAHAAVVACLGTSAERAEVRGGFGWRVVRTEAL